MGVIEAVIDSPCLLLSLNEDLEVSMLDVVGRIFVMSKEIYCEISSGRWATSSLQRLWTGNLELLANLFALSYSVICSSTLNQILQPKTDPFSPYFGQTTSGVGCRQGDFQLTKNSLRASFDLGTRA